MHHIRTTFLGALVLVALAATAPAHAGPTSGSLSNAGYYKLQSIGDVKFQYGLFTMTCTNVTIVSNAVAVNATAVTAAGGFGTSHVIISTCTVGSIQFVVTTGGTWTFTANERTATGPPELWKVSLTPGTATIEALKEDCKVTLDPAQTVTGSFNDADPPDVPNTELALNAKLAVTGKGDWFFCPTGNDDVTLVGTFAVSANTQQDFKGSGVVVNLF